MEFGTTTGRKRLVNWLNLDYLIKAINISGTNKLIINKCDILTELNDYRVIINKEEKILDNIEVMENYISYIIRKECYHCSNIVFSSNKNHI